jgi:hypothetical protein
MFAAMTTAAHIPGLFRAPRAALSLLLLSRL